MNEFERAQARTEKRELRKTLSLPPKSPVLVPEPVIPIAPKEKRPNTDGVITVSVDLPYDQFELIFTKANITGMKKLSRADFHKAFSEGLRPLLGVLK